MICILKQFSRDCIRAIALYWAIMEQVIALSTQNPLSILVKFGMMAWNNSCGIENCSGHGECHNGTCLCEVIILFAMLNHPKMISISFNYYSVLDSIWWTRMSYSKSKLLRCFCYNLFFISFCLLDTTCHVHCCWMAKNEGTIIFESMQGYYSKSVILCSFSCISYTRCIFYITGMYKQILYFIRENFSHILMHF